MKPRSSSLFAPALGACFVALGALGSAWAAQQVPLPTPEPELTGSVEASHRWRSMAGSDLLYRSTVDLGRGPKLDRFDFSYVRDPERSYQGLVDFATVRMHSWGGEPASALRAEWGKNGSYDAELSYRSVAYFNTIPSFANPSPGFSGASQQWMDINRGLLDGQVTLRPGTRVVPFLSFSRDSGRGPGKTTFVQDANEFAVSSETDNRTHTFRGGVYLRFDQWNGIIEAGGSSFRDDQRLSFSGDSPGNRSALLFGRRLRLTDLNQSYRAEGTDRFVRVRLEGRLRDEVTVFGQFAFSQPTIDLDYSQANSGEFVLFQTLGFFTGESGVGSAHAAWPRPSGSIGVEYRPTSRLRIVDTLWLDRSHISGSSATERTLSGDSAGSVSEGGSRRIESELTRHRFHATFSLHRRLSIYGGHTYTAATALAPGSELAASEERSIGRHTGELGVSARPTDRLELRSDVQATGGDEVFFRTDTRRYARWRIHGRFRFADNLSGSVAASLWNNTNDLPDVDLEQRNRDLTLDVAFTPNVGALTAIHGSYTRTTFSSDVPFLIPENFTQGISAYRNRAHVASLTAILAPRARLGLDLGGQLFVSTDDVEDGLKTRPTRFYEARARLGFEVNERLRWNGGWTWYGYRNRARAGEDFRTHLISTGFTYAF